MKDRTDAAVIKAYANRAWITCDLWGNAHVYVQSEMPGSNPVKVATIFYDYGYACNIGKRDIARSIASRFDSRPIEERQMDLSGFPTGEADG